MIGESLLQDKIEAQAARIKALESRSDVLRSNVYEKASDPSAGVQYEGLLETFEREHADKVKTSGGEKNNTLVLKQAADNCEARIKAFGRREETLGEAKRNVGEGHAMGVGEKGAQS